jgi:hypothetical protein
MNYPYSRSPRICNPLIFGRALCPAMARPTPWGPDDFVIAADEKTYIQARRRCAASQPANSHQTALF